MSNPDRRRPRRHRREAPKHPSADVRQRLDAIYDKRPEKSELNLLIEQLQNISLLREDWSDR